MVSRHWRGVSRGTEADSYVRYLQHNIFPQFAQMAGFVSASVLQRPVAAGVEFCVVLVVRRQDEPRSVPGSRSQDQPTPKPAQTLMRQRPWNSCGSEGGARCLRSSPPWG